MGKYRNRLKQLEQSADDIPVVDWFFASDVYSLLDEIEQDYNNKVKSVLSNIEDLKDSVESDMEDMSEDLY